MKIFFAKSKKTGIFCIIAAVLTAALALFAGYYALGNMRCAQDSPILISENGNGIFIGYYLLAAGYTALFVIALLLTAYLVANAVRAILKFRAE